MSVKILQGSCLETLSSLKEKSVNTCVTSPPYWGLRDYGTGEWFGGDPDCNHVKSENKHGGQRSDRDQEGYKKLYNYKCFHCGAVRKDNQLGQEETPEQFVQNLVKVFQEVRRVLRDDGTVWLNLGDSYARTGGDSAEKSRHWDNRKNNPNTGHNRYAKKIGLKQKDLVGIPWRVAFALQADGWYLRQDIIWHKPNPMPESVQDRCTKSHEYIFLLSKSPKYYYDNEAIKYGLENSNKRSVWTVTTKPYSEAHFATYPHDLIIPCILAGCPEGGIVLDPFGGSGTTAQVANNLNRNAILCELNPEYVDIAKGRLHDSLGMFMDLDVVK